jgi:lysophospholipase L1-like esterase
VRVVDLNEMVCPGGHYVGEADGVVVRFDGVHFSAEGADWVARRLVPALLAATAPAPAASTLQ